MFKNLSYEFKMILLVVFGVIISTSVVYFLNPPIPSTFSKVASTQVLGGQNGGIIDTWEYRGRGIICLSQILVVPNAQQTYTSVVTNCVKD